MAHAGDGVEQRQLRAWMGSFPAPDQPRAGRENGSQHRIDRVGQFDEFGTVTQTADVGEERIAGAVQETQQSSLRHWAWPMPLSRWPNISATFELHRTYWTPRHIRSYEPGRAIDHTSTREVFALATTSSFAASSAALCSCLARYISWSARVMSSSAS